MNHYEAKQEERRQRYLAQADKARAKADRRRKAADRITDMIPFGQPILVGHHSEKRHRSDLKKFDNHMRKGIEAREMAAHYAHKAESVGKGGISSDDPDATEKLTERLAALEDKQARMKATNKAHKAYLKNPDSLDTWDGLEYAKQLVRSYEPAYSWEPHPFAPYQLTNNNGNIRRIKERIAEIEKRSELKTTEKQVGKVQIVQNVEDNRTQIFFPGKPSDEIRTKLKRNGFRWSRLNGCWQRHLSKIAEWTAESIAKAIIDIPESEQTL